MESLKRQLATTLCNVKMVDLALHVVALYVGFPSLLYIILGAKSICIDFF